MKHKFECPHCAQRISATPDLFGATRSCPACSQKFVVPAPEGYVAGEERTRNPAEPGMAYPQVPWRSFTFFALILFCLIAGGIGLLHLDLLRRDPSPLAVIYTGAGHDNAAAAGAGAGAGAGDEVRVSPTDPDQQQRLADLQRRVGAQEAAMTELKTTLSQRAH